MSSIFAEFVDTFWGGNRENINENHLNRSASKHYGLGSSLDIPSPSSEEGWRSFVTV